MDAKNSFYNTIAEKKKKKAQNMSTYINVCGLSVRITSRQSINNPHKMSGVLTFIPVLAMRCGVMRTRGYMSI